MVLILYYPKELQWFRHCWRCKSWPRWLHPIPTTSRWNLHHSLKLGSASAIKSVIGIGWRTWCSLFDKMQILYSQIFPSNSLTSHGSKPHLPHTSPPEKYMFLETHLVAVRPYWPMVCEAKLPMKGPSALLDALQTTPSSTGHRWTFWK